MPNMKAKNTHYIEGLSGNSHEIKAKATTTEKTEVSISEGRDIMMEERWN